MRKIGRIILLLSALLCILLAWEYGFKITDSYRIATQKTPLQAFIPTPSTIFRTILEQHSLLATEASYTIIRALSGYLLAVIISFTIASLGFFVPKLHRMFLPLMFAINSFPVVGFAPLFVLLFGQGNTWGIITISALIAYFPLYIGFSSSFTNLNSDLVAYLQSLRAKPKDIYMKVALPSSVSSFFSASHLAIPASIVGATMGEWLGTQHGLGRLVTIALYQLKPGLLYASLSIIVLISILMMTAVKLAAKHFQPKRY